MMIIGICGKAGVGKSTAARFLNEELGFKYIKIDEVVESVIEGHLEEINDYVVGRFQIGPYSREEIYDSYFSKGIVPALLDFEFRGYIDRLLFEELLKWKVDTNSMIVIDWFMLELSKMFQLCDYRILLEAPYDIRKERVINRGNYAEHRFPLIEAAISVNNRAEYHLILNTSKSNWLDILKERVQFDIQGERLVSIIVPVYNQEERLGKCLKSILESSYRNIELIVVNDGSTDGTHYVIENFHKNDKRLVFINQENKGVGNARNTALEIAKGEYIGFVDSDDYIDKNMITILLKNALVTGADIVRCRANMCPRGSEYLPIISPIEGEQKLITLSSSKEIIEGYINREVSIAVWDKLFLADICRKIKFDEKIFNEDAKFVWQACRLANRICCTNQKLYYHVKREGGNSLTGHPFDGRFFSVEEFCDDVTAELGKEYKHQRNVFVYNAQAHVLKTFIRDRKLGKIKEDYSNQMTHTVNLIFQILFEEETYKDFYDLENVLTIIKELRGENFLDEKKLNKCSLPCIGIFWNSVDEKLIAKALKVFEKYKIYNIASQTIELENDLADFIADTYALNKDKDFVIPLKKNCLVNRYSSNTIHVISFVQEVNCLQYLSRKKEFIYMENEQFRNEVRGLLKEEIENYVFDTSFHLTDSLNEYIHMKNVLLNFNFEIKE